MRAPTKLQAAEEELKRLIADVTRATQRAQEAIANVATKTTPTAPAMQAATSVHE